jgi:hypothetical protein
LLAKYLTKYHYQLKSTFCLLFILFVTEAGAQKMAYKGFPSLVWPVLYNIEYQSAKDEKGNFDRPVFTKEIQKLNGKQVTLPGYIVPFESGLKSKRFMLSSLPLNACFFCGVGGPETVVEVIATEEIAYTDKPVEITGTLRLNGTDPDKMIYTVEQARFLGEIEF